MDYQKINCPNYNIHLIHDKRFHTIVMKVFFFFFVSSEKITYRNCLANLLTDATQKYDNRQKVIRQAQDLYAIYPYATVSRLGNLLVTKFVLSTIVSKDMKEDYLKENLLFLKEIILNPLIDKNGFNQKYLTMTIKNQENDYKVALEDPRFYANMALFKMFDDDEVKNYNLTGYCDLDVLKKINPKSMYDSYQEMLKEAKIDIFLAGDIKNDQEIIDYIQEIFSFNSKPHLQDAMIYHHTKKEIIMKQESKDYYQSKLAIGVKAYQLTKDEIKYLFPFLGILLGGYGDSLLMNNVRDQKSLAYYAYCFYNKLDNFLVINSGIDKKNYEVVLETIKRTLKEIQEGKFSSSKIKECQLVYLSQLEKIKESNSNLIEYYYGRELLQTDELEERIMRVKKITKKDIVMVAKKLEIAGIYFLEGAL